MGNIGPTGSPGDRGPQGTQGDRGLPGEWVSGDTSGSPGVGDRGAGGLSLQSRSSGRLERVTPESRSRAVVLTPRLTFLLLPGAPGAVGAPGIRRNPQRIAVGGAQWVHRAEAPRGSGEMGPQGPRGQVGARLGVAGQGLGALPALFPPVCTRRHPCPRPCRFPRGCRGQQAGPQGRGGVSAPFPDSVETRGLWGCRDPVGFEGE